MNEKIPVDRLSFEDALAELESIVRALETGQAKLADSIALYERGVALKQHCEAQLRTAQEKIEKITVAPNGAVATELFGTEES
ncbi:MAG: exodeoxyribonuclease VII small subunit [Alphaproteobacteria bacterium]|nr:exodeoxyribonuclease VII small subunit [Alphaproteobacteria bacterium]